MNIKMNNSYLEIDIGILQQNVRAILSQLPEGCQLIPVLKDNAYGLGLEKVASTLCEFDDVRCLAVAHVSEGLALRECGISREILVMGGVLPFQYEAAVDAGLTLACGRLGLASELADTAERMGRKAVIQIKIDTGLHRIGIEAGDELDAFLSELEAVRDKLIITGAFSHFSDASLVHKCEAQFDRFKCCTERIEAAGFTLPVKHISSSGVSELFPQFDMDAVRLGRRLYMDNPSTPLGDIKELASWRGFITNIKHRHEGETLGYGSKVSTPSECDIATVSVGYGDGLNQQLATVRAPVLVNGKYGHLAACCMDQCMIDVTDIECGVGDEVTFFGYDRSGNYLSSQTQAALINDDEGCGLTSALSDRVARIYKY